MSTTSSKNFTTLYSGSGSVVPQGAYGNANVVSLLNVGTDGANTVGNISATGNVTAAYFIGNGSLLTNINAGNITGNVNYANTAGTAQYVTANAQANITSVGILTSLSVSGNVTGGNIITAGAVSAAGASVSGNITGGNLISSGAITATGNVTAANFFGNVFGNIVGNVDAAGSDTQIQFNTGNLLDASANLTFDKSTNIFKVTGNTTYPTSGIEFTANSITGNVSLGNLVITNQFQASSRGPVVIDTTALVVGQDNAGLNTNATIQAIRNQALELTTTNAGAPAVYVGKYVSGNPAFTGNVDVRSSNVGGYAGTGDINLTGNVYVSRQAQGSDTANARANLIVTDGVYVNQGISAAGNITGNVFIGNGAGLTNINASNVVGAYGNANVSNFLANGFGSNTILTTGNITSGNLITGGNVFGNVIGASVSGVGTANLNITQSGDSLGTTTLNVAANIAVFGGSASSVITSAPGSNLQLTTNQGGSPGQPRMFVDQYDPGVQAGNVDIRTGGGAISGGFAANATVNISGNVRVGPYAPGVAPASTGVNLEVAGAVTATGNVTGGNLITAGLVSATANITGANLVATANLTSTQQTIIGTANVGTTGNIVISGKNIATDMAWSPDGGTAATAPNGRVMIGTGWNGNITHTGTQSRLFVNDAITRGAATNNVRELDVDMIVSLTGNVTNGAIRTQGVGSRVRIGGGSAGNTMNLTNSGAGTVNAVAGLQPNIDVGNVSPYFLGNTHVSHATLNGGFITTYSGGSVGNAYGMIPGTIASTTGNAAAAGNITNYIGFASNMGASPYITGNLYGFYHPNAAGTADQTATNLGMAGAARAATNYYAFRNDDPVAQVKLGSLRTYHEYQYSTATSGTVNIDKTNAQVQYINPTANITIGSYTNFVTTASNSASNLNQADTVTLIIEQGATPYTVTMPTGNAAIKYLSGTTTVGATANAVSIVTIKAIRSAANATMYLTSISSEYT